MTTAAEYRSYAQECMQSARDANEDAVRVQFLELAQLWMLAAQKLDGKNPFVDGHDSDLPIGK